MSSRLKKTYIEKNTNSETKLLIIAEHAGNLIPSEFDNLGLNDDDRRRHISYDIGVFEICRILSETTPTDLGSFESSKDGFLGTLTSTLVESL